LFFFQAEDGIRDFHVTGVQTCALPISRRPAREVARVARHRSPPHPAMNSTTPSEMPAMNRFLVSALFASFALASVACGPKLAPRSEEHTSELQSRENLVCRLLLEKKKK